MVNEDKVCCMCNEHKKFLSRVNTGNNYYCISCIAKINKSGMKYWKPCTDVEFFESMLSHMKKGKNRKSTNMFSSLKEQFEKFENDERDDSKSTD